MVDRVSGEQEVENTQECVSWNWSLRTKICMK